MMDAEPTTRPRYTGVAILLHWVSALLIFINLVLMGSIDVWPQSGARPMINVHKSIGITVLGLVLVRVFWRLTHRPPPFAAHYRRYESWAARFVHRTFYVVMLALPLTGWMRASAWEGAATHPMRLFGIVGWPHIGAIVDLPPAFREQLHGQLGTAHASAGYALYVLLILHIGAVLKHHWLDRHPEMQRMLPQR